MITQKYLSRRHLIADVFVHGAWVDLKSIEDPSLKDLVATLPSLVLHGKAPATINYSGAFGRWKKWAASSQEIPTLPGKPVHVALYLSYLAQSARTAAPLEEVVNALSWVHRMATVEDITDHPIVVQVLLLAHKTTKKKPITTEHLTLLVQRLKVPVSQT